LGIVTLGVILLGDLEEPTLAKRGWGTQWGRRTDHACLKLTPRGASPAPTKAFVPIACFRYALLDAVVGGFAGDDDVVDVGFAEAGAADADEAAVGFEIVERGGSDVAHAGFEAADELFSERA
jgi:hypothetical protein